MIDSSPTASGICMCGCGKNTSPYKRTNTKRGAIKGEPTRYLLGHAGGEPKRLPCATALERLCACGCGEKTAIAPATRTRFGAIKGQPRRFVVGHHLRKSPVPYIELPGPLDTPCWVWQRATSGHGYGVMWHKKRMAPAHRVYYEQAHGPIPEGLDLDHLCRNPPCVNPLHLEPVTHAENTRRGLKTRFTAAQIAEIRAIKGMTLRAIGERFGTTLEYIWLIRHYGVWRAADETGNIKPFHTVAKVPDDQEEEETAAEQVH